MTEVGGSSRPVKGILKKSRSERARQYETEEELEEGLMCNVPQHHDLVSRQSSLPLSIHLKFYL